MSNSFFNIAVNPVTRDDNLVAAQIWFLKGTKDEPYKKNGMFHLVEHLLIASNPFEQDWFAKKHFTGTTSQEVVKFGFICEKDKILVNLRQLFKYILKIPITKEILSLQKRKVINEIQYRKEVDFFQFLDAGLDVVFKESTYSNCSGGEIQTVEALGYDEIKKYWNILFENTPFRLSIVGKLQIEEVADIYAIYQENNKKYNDYNLSKIAIDEHLLLNKVYITSESRAAMFFFKGPGKIEQSYVYLKIIEILLNQCIDSYYMVRTSAISYHAIGFILLFVREENFKRVEEIKNLVIEIINNISKLNMAVNLLCHELMLYQQDIAFQAQQNMERGLFGYNVLDIIQKTPRDILLNELKEFALKLFLKRNVCLIQSDKTNKNDLDIWT